MVRPATPSIGPFAPIAGQGPGQDSSVNEGRQGYAVRRIEVALGLPSGGDGQLTEAEAASLCTGGTIHAWDRLAFDSLREELAATSQYRHERRADYFYIEQVLRRSHSFVAARPSPTA